MPELPEVETTLRGIQPHIEGQQISKITVRHHQLRWPIPRHLNQLLQNKVIHQVQRRAKYLLLDLQIGTLILHLGMSGSLKILSHATPAQKHDHIDFELKNKKILRFTDPRRFGAVLWTEDDPMMHALLKNLGPEPLSKEFSGRYLWQRAQKKQTNIKSFIMNNKIVVGVGNIYAAEALFLAKLHPQRAVNTMTQDQFEQLAKAIKVILRQSIKKGGTTLKDFVDSNGQPGYFSQSLKVYGRVGLACEVCGTKLQSARLGQRSTVFCVKCQK